MTTTVLVLVSLVRDRSATYNIMDALSDYQQYSSGATVLILYGSFPSPLAQRYELTISCVEDNLRVLEQ